MKYEVIQFYKGTYPVKALCEFLGVSESSYYAWLKRESSERMCQDATLKETLVSTWKRFHGIYGAPRIYKELKAQGIGVGQKRVARLMRELGIHGKMARRKRPQTTQSDETHPGVPNLLNRQFKVNQANQVWLTGDIATYSVMETPALVNYCCVSPLLECGRIIFVVSALLGKGAALGTVLAFMMSIVALSLPEMFILQKILKPRLIAFFLAS